VEQDQESKRIEAVAQLVHEQRHRLGGAQVCDGCRELARSIDRVYRRFPAER
jgi:hypothetical protein